MMGGLQVTKPSAAQAFKENVGNEGVAEPVLTKKKKWSLFGRKIGSSKNRQSILNLFSQRSSETSSECSFEIEEISIPISCAEDSEDKSCTSTILSLQSYLESFVEERGYSSDQFETLKCAYYNEPTALQKASYHSRLEELVKKNDIDTLKQLIDSGISSNPSNDNGDSLVHLICRFAKPDLLNLLIESNGSNTVQIANAKGQTPMHVAFQSVTNAEDNLNEAENFSFEIIKLLLKQDHRLLFTVDEKGALPLSNIPEQQWECIKEFLVSIGDTIWPKRDLFKEGEEEVPECCKKCPNSLPLADPVNALSFEMAQKAVAGESS